MDQEEYISTQNQLVLLGQLIDGLDLRSFLEKINHAESFGPILNPTLFIKAGKKLEQVKNLAEAALIFQTEFRKQKEEANNG
jgi:hypothetical protein